MCNLPFDTYTQHQIMDNRHGSPLPRLLRACMNRPRWKFTLNTAIRLYSYMIHQALLWWPKQEIKSWPLCIKPNSRDSGISNLRTSVPNAHTLSQCFEWKKATLECTSLLLGTNVSGFMKFKRESPDIHAEIWIHHWIWWQKFKLLNKGNNLYMCSNNVSCVIWDWDY